MGQVVAGDWPAQFSLCFVVNGGKIHTKSGSGGSGGLCLLGLRVEKSRLRKSTAVAESA